MAPLKFIKKQTHELKESEAQAAWDAHDCSDAGMEAAMMERSVMLANEMAHKMKEKAAKQSQNGSGRKSANEGNAASFQRPRCGVIVRLFGCIKKRA